MTEQDIVTPEQEWSYNFMSEEIDKKPVHVKISAPEKSLPLLCKRMDLHSIEGVTADIVLTRNDVTKAIRIEGQIDAKVQQKCIITGEAVAEHIRDSFEAWYAEPNNAVSFTKAKRERTPQDRNEQPILEEQDDPEEIIDGKIDLGELVTQHLSLSLNPYPRLEGVEYDVQASDLAESDDMYANPFAALKDWKAGEKKKDK